MDRYGLLYGANETGVYGFISISSGVQKYLTSLGAPGAKLTLTKVMGYLCDYAELPGYENQPKNQPPLAVRYAPMHLYNLPDMPNNMKPFCAIAVNGMEAVRNRKYNQIHIISRRAMQKITEGYSFLDQIFGTPLLRTNEFIACRNGERKFDCDALPAKVSVEDCAQEVQNVALKALQAIYERKSVIIRLEAGYSFNEAAMDLLKQIYSRMQPRLATEIGFATYIEPAKISNLMAHTSIRIFVLPAEVEPDKSLTEGSNVLYLDLNQPQSKEAPQESELIGQLRAWQELPAQMRLEAMESIFDSDTLDYMSPDKFIELSRPFLAEFHAVYDWLTAVTEDEDTIDSIEALRAELQKRPLCAKIPTLRDAFRQKAVRLLKAPNTLDSLATDAAYCALMAREESPAEEKRWLANQKFAQDLGGMVDAAQIFRQSSDYYMAEIERQVEAVKEKSAEDLRQQRAKCEEVVAGTRSECDARVAAEVRKNEDLRRQLAAKAAEHQAEMDSVKAADEARIAEANQRAMNWKAECERAKSQSGILAAQQKMQEAAAMKAEAERAYHEVRRVQLDVKEKEAELEDRERFVKSAKIKFVIFAAAGLLVGMLIIGLIWGLTALLGGKAEEEAPEVTLPQETQAVQDIVPQPTPTPVVEESEVRTVEDVLGEMSAVMLVLTGEDADAFCPEALAETHAVKAVFSLYDVAKQDLFTTPMEVLQDIVDENGVVIGQETVLIDEPGEPYAVVLEGAPVAELEAFGNADAVLQTDDLQIAVYGDGATILAARDVLAQLADEDAAVTVALGDGEGGMVDLSMLTQTSLQWLGGITDIRMDSELIAQDMERIGMEKQPVAVIETEDVNLFVFGADEATEGSIVVEKRVFPEEEPVTEEGLTEEGAEAGSEDLTAEEPTQSEDAAPSEDADAASDNGDAA